MPLGQISRFLIIIGISLIIIGLLVRIIDNTDWFKSIPGTIRFNIGSLTYVIPLLASIMLSILLTILLNVIGRLLNH